MTRALRLTWLLVAIAAVLVTGAGTFVFRRNLEEVYVPCRGTMAFVLPTNTGRPVPLAGSPVRVGENRRVTWRRPDGAPTCNDLAMSSARPPGAELRVRDRGGGIYEIDDGDQRLAVSLQESRGHRFDPARFEVRAQIPALVFLVAIVALVVAALSVVRATTYANRLSRWSEATLREDGVVESRSGRTIGKLAPHVQLPSGDVIVEPAGNADLYRSLRMLARGEVGVGDHDRWRRGTWRRLRDARVLAAVASLTTLAAMLARALG